MIAMDFQNATAERILNIYREQGQNRVLLADEVGLGKTIIAKEVIRRVSRWHKNELKDDHFKVVYICSNINIARQNIKKLILHEKKDISKGSHSIYDIIKEQQAQSTSSNGSLDVSRSRLSMQHLKIYQNAGSNHDYVQIIPLTPATSFTMTSGCGNQDERALMFVHLKRLDCFNKIEEELSELMAFDAEKYWEGYCEYYEEQIIKCNDKCTNYISDISNMLEERLSPELIGRIQSLCLSNKQNDRQEVRSVINNLRRVFAQISLDKLEPDLVIMDEFQRFRDIITPQNEEQEMLSKQFLSDIKTKVLLLSATPYKPYSTLEEISLNEDLNHYKDFMQVLDFLLYDTNKNVSFKKVWNDYSNALSHIDGESISALIAHKNCAEEKMYDSICRTERFNAGVIDDSGAKEIPISAEDITSYCEAQNLIDIIKSDRKYQARVKNVPIDYIKSSPYLLSFMENYQLKKEIENYFRKTKNYGLINKSKKQTLLLEKNAIHYYKAIPSNNARLIKLKETVFQNDKSGIENLLWVPPSKPYYDAKGIFEKNKNFSKTLVFSSWEIVPRMIAAMLSYEAELRTIGKLYAEEKRKRGRGYFASKEEKRYGTMRLKGEYADIVLYPSKYLASIYNPINYMDKDISFITKDISKIITTKLKEVKHNYHLAQGGSGVKTLLGLLKALDGDLSELGTIPDNAVEVFTNMAIGSPAVCLYRIFDNVEPSAPKVNQFTEEVAKAFVALFNKAESAAILDNLYGKSEDVYFENVFKYCVSGNIQAMLDEFAHVLNETGDGLKNAILESFADTSSVQIDTMESFTNADVAKPRIRTHFAVGYFNARISDENVQRTEKIRNAFNSPFRPFVLATTSIGQEGLDFHLYCRKIVHWNLPSNPVDLEQREGRINRYKCLAIRQNIANMYQDENSWDKMFQKASTELKANNSDMIPFWCLPENSDTAIKIERIVPMYPLSQDIMKYNHLIKVLSLYRLTLGQPRQEELIEMLGQKGFSEIDKKLFIDLCPFNREKQRIMEEN